MTKIQKDDDKNLKNLSIGIVILIIIGWIATIVILKDKPNRGTFGDMFGSINAIYSGLALAGIIITILLQRKELKLQREELKETRKEFQIQNETLKIQRFENTFFNLLSLHHKIVEGIDFRRIESKSIFGKLAFQEDEEDDGATIMLTGRDVFKLLYDRLYEDMKYQEDDFLETYLNHYEKSQADFGHYFRNLYRILKLVDTTDFEFGSSNWTKEKLYKIKYGYTSIVRAQISDYELLWIFYNCLSPNGIEKFKPLIEKYSFFKNIPQGKLAKKEHSGLYNAQAFEK